MIFITAYAQDEFWQQFVERNDQPQTLRKFTFNVQFRYFPWQELFHSITVHHFPHIWANFVSFFMHPFVHLPAPQNEESCNTYSLSSRRKNLIHKARFFSENCAYIYTDIHTYILGILCQASAPDQEPTCTTHQSGSSTLAQILHASGKHTATITAKNAFYTTFFYDIKLN